MSIQLVSHDLTVVQSGTNIYGKTIYDVYDGNDWVGSGSDWAGVRDVYDIYCSISGLSNGCTVNYNYPSDYGTYPVYLVPNSSTTGGLLHNAGWGGVSLNNAIVSFPGFSLGVDGIFIAWEDIQKENLNSQMKTYLAHESQHYFEQGIVGFGLWTAAYYGEIGLKWAWYGGNYLDTTYNMNSFEIRARVASGASPYLDSGPATTHWWDPGWNSCKQALKTFDYWMATGH
jgi:hypothetical protein